MEYSINVIYPIKIESSNALRYSFNRHNVILKQNCKSNVSPELFWSTMSDMTKRFNMSENDIKELLFVSWSPKMATLFTAIENTESVFIKQINMLQKATLPVALPCILRHKLYTAKRKPNQDILRFYAYLTSIADGAFEDQNHDIKENMKMIIMKDILFFNVSKEVQYALQHEEITNISDMLSSIKRHEEEGSQKEILDVTRKKCLRCESLHHTTSKCSIYKGWIPSSSCKKCHKGLHKTKSCKFYVNVV